MPVVDFHTHFFSRPFFDTLAAQSPRPGEPDAKLAALAERTGIEVPSPDVATHRARWIAALDAGGVDTCVTFASLPEEVPAVAEAIAGDDGRLIGMAIANPVAVGAADKVAGLLDQRGFRGVLCFPAQHRFRIDDERAHEVLTVLNERRAVCYVHCGLLVVKLKDLLGIPRTVDLTFANPLHLIPAANAFPDVTFVIPHFGAGMFRETLMVGAQCENVVVDSSSSNAWRSVLPEDPSLRHVLDRALDVYGVERVLFGTDSGPFPAGWRQDRYEEQLELFTQLGLGAAERELVFGGNARRILGLA
jgi:predicted TIM-barrel fold metal-dependent hydrolase